MSEDPTKDLTAVEMLRLLLADVRDMKSRLGAVESRLGAVESRFGAVESRFGAVESRFGAVETELTALRSTVEDRFKDTRPIWQAINARTERIEETLIDLKEQMGRLAYRDLELDAAQARLSSRVRDLESRASDSERRTD